jgi:hypothetical protein
MDKAEHSKENHDAINRVATHSRCVRIVVVCSEFIKGLSGGRMRAQSESIFDRAQGVGVTADDAAG